MQTSRNRALRAGRTLAAAGLCAALAAGCGGGRETPDGSGTIECTQVLVAPQVGGRLQDVGPREGDAVTNGQVVAHIDALDHRLRRDEARAALDAAVAQLDLVLAGSREEDVQRARAQAREARAASEAAAADLLRIRQVFATKSATRKQMDDAQAAADRTAAALAAAEQNAAKLAAGSRPEEIRIAGAQVDVARARLATLEKALDDCVVTSPLDGVVTTRIREDGEFVAAGTPLLSVSRLGEVWLSIYVPGPRLAGVRLGQSARVQPDGTERAFAGTVTFVSPEAEFTPRNVQTPEERAKLVYRVKITLPNPEGIFKPGMPADGYLEAAE